MNRIEQFQAAVSEKGKSVLGYTADWVEWSARKNLEIADDLADFTVAQLRLPIEAQDFTDYRLGLRDTYSDLGDVLKQYGEDYVAKLKDIPNDVREIFAPKKVAKKATAKSKAAKPKAAKPKAAKPKVTKPKVARTAKAVKAEPARTTATV